MVSHGCKPQRFGTHSLLSQVVGPFEQLDDYSLSLQETGAQNMIPRFTCSCQDSSHLFYARFQRCRINSRIAQKEKAVWETFDVLQIDQTEKEGATTARHMLEKDFVQTNSRRGYPPNSHVNGARDR